MNRIRISTVQIIPVTFILAITVGTLLLLLPFATAPGEHTGFLTALFTATTSVCVTGLVVVDTYSHWSLFGQIIILILVQIGGLGVVAVGSMFMIMGKRKFTLSARKLLNDSLNVEKNRGLRDFLVRIFKGVFLVEGIGAFLYALNFVPRYGFFKGVWAAIFQAVSAFCNAGMDVVGPNSMMEFRDSNYLMFLTMAIIILGGLGFVVWFDIVDGLFDGIKKRFSPRQIVSHLSEHTKLVLLMTVSLLILGTVIVFLAEYNNPDTMQDMGLWDKFLNSLFQSVTFRTAGFASVPQDGLSETTCLVGYVLMFIGGSPVGTAGGVKTVTAFLVLMNAFSYITGHKENIVFKRKVSEEMMRKAAAVVFVSFMMICIMTVLLMGAAGVSMTDALYEIVSALATVGLSRGLTPNLNAAGRIIVIVSMYLGRIGPISMAIFFSKAKVKENRIEHSEGTFYVG